ncbi:NAD(P)-binding protein [Amylocystis lapponica]|nr:NAD(P)-binding protein [Amylocystis lapponica]
MTTLLARCPGRPPRTLLHIMSTSTFSTSPPRLVNRALVYMQNGNPTDVLRALSYPALPAPPPRGLNIRFRLSPINPSDINVIEGVYPAKPAPTTALSGVHKLDEPVYVVGNEGLAEVVAVGSHVDGLKRGDWVVMAKSQAGTWASERVVGVDDVIKLPDEGVSEVNGATMTTNPPTAYNMLRDYVELSEGDWVVQNGTCVALVGQMVVQIAAKMGLKTINFVRNRPNLDELTERLRALGATHVFTYDDLADRAFFKSVKELTGDKDIRLLLNCVSGTPTSQMVRLLGPDAHLVSYGAMSKQPLSMPTSAFLFKNLTAHGFWQSRWNKAHSADERAALMRTLANFKLKEPEHEIVVLESKMSDAEAAQTVRDAIARVGQGMYGKKVLLKIESPD